MQTTITASTGAAASALGVHNNKKRKIDVAGNGELDCSTAEPGGAVSALGVGPVVTISQGLMSNAEGELANEEDEIWDEAGDIKRNVKRILKVLEEELGTTTGLHNNTKILACDASFAESERPQEVDTLARIHSGTSSKYIDVHFSYRYKTGWSSVDWGYSIGYKISRRPAPDTPIPAAALRNLGCRPVGQRYGTQGWRSVAHGAYDHRDVEGFAFDMDPDGLLDVHEALWGPLADLRPGASADEHANRRRALLRALRVLLAVVGIDYRIACVEGESDSDVNEYSDRGIPWMLEGTGDHWVARCARKVCGFQLARDAGEEEKGWVDRAEEAREYERAAKGYRDDVDDEDEEDEDGYSSDGGSSGITRFPSKF